MSSVHEVIWMTQLLGCCAGNVGYTGKSVTAFMLCRCSRDLCLGWRWALSEAGTGRDACVVRACCFTHSKMNSLAQPKEAEAYCESDLQLGVCGVCTSLRELGCFVGFVKQAVVALCLPFSSSSVACLPPQAMLKPRKTTEWLSSERAAASSLALGLYGEVQSIEGKQRGNLWLVKSAVGGSSAQEQFGRNW